MHIVFARTRPGVILRALCWVLVAQTASVSAQTRHSLSLGKEVAVFGTGFMFHGLSLVQARRPMPTLQWPLDATGLPGIDRRVVGNWDPGAHRASNVLFGVAAATSLATALLVQGGEEPMVPVVILFQSGLIASGITNVVKEAVRRPRPYLYDPDVPPSLHHGHDDQMSFWSGHTASTAALTFTTANLVQHSDASQGVKTATWISAATLPAAMGWLRVRAGRHFITDVVTGYVFGALVGWAVPYIHRTTYKQHTP